MLAGSALKFANRPSYGRFPILRRRPLAAYTTSAKFFDPSVLTIGHQNSEQLEDSITIQGNKPVKSAVADVARTAMPLSSNVISQLTPTLSKFTLRDKVAVVTG